MEKRIFDLLITSLAAISWMPAFIFTALAIAIFEGLPVFYISLRVTGLNKVRRVVKFRTMVRNAEAVYNRNTVPISDGVHFLNLPPESELYTRTGRIIERLAFTEIPQLLLVLRGDMSLVGNRPLPENVMRSLRDVYADVDDRLLTPAGMSGPVQLVGRERLSDRQRLDLEIAYCHIASRTSTWRLDFLILAFTVLEALRLARPMTVDKAREFMLRQAGLSPRQLRDTRA